MVNSTPKQQAYWTNKNQVFKFNAPERKEEAAETSAMAP
eukprot:CAMPEP_0113624012 /NCGR_PEP_ID=MMETSP0017_2-20120614/12371_1 /TAXON_ID=2856 /ORGANISM="Cylindrotheca closterium" /LENGTH=38 /DNA_ID=CAMNT_0000534015 /DNA_START=39 /DNA_END=151 /DNA_ORIENTATION=+ /assembly_acc=CAM_ASM_000147